MTPQVAIRLKVHEEEAALDIRTRRRRLMPATDASAAALAAERFASVPADEWAPAPTLWRESIQRRMLGVADVVSAGLVLALTLSLFGQHRVAIAAFGGAALVGLLFKIAGLYDRDDLRLVHSSLDEVPQLVQLTCLFALCVAALQTVLLAGTLHAEQIAALWLASLGAILSGRLLARALGGRAAPQERCLVIGEPEQADRIREKVASSRACAAVVASLPLAAEDVVGGDRATLRLTFRAIVGELGLHRIIIAPTTTDTGVIDLIRIAKASGVRVSVLPRMFEVIGSAVEFDEVDGMTMLGIRRFGLARSSRALKRAFDIVVASIGLVVVGPLILGLALAIRLDSKGPTFFRQVRVGRGGKHFRMFKFRSMIVGADAQKDGLRSLNEAGDGLFKITDDPRVTRVGRFLRRTSLDELPQLFNVLRGEMSLVGPRPLVIDEDAQVLGLDRSRLHLTPGMTGPWQVLGVRVPMQEMVGIDYLYVANWSLWHDLKILLRTVRHVARRGNL
jgi:exopolysaccharide biosynthesis polyprenyl glycosylphosphotransferase